MRRDVRGARAVRESGRGRGERQGEICARWGRGKGRREGQRTAGHGRSGCVAARTRLVGDRRPLVRREPTCKRASLVHSSVLCSDGIEGQGPCQRAPELDGSLLDRLAKPLRLLLALGNSIFSRCHKALLARQRGRRGRGRLRWAEKRWIRPRRALSRPLRALAPRFGRGWLKTSGPSRGHHAGSHEHGVPEAGRANDKGRGRDCCMYLLCLGQEFLHKAFSQHFEGNNWTHQKDQNLPWYPPHAPNHVRASLVRGSTSLCTC